jgi:regulation of enolase protein 1 (concanavalin A-like superfamily)
MCRKLIYLMLCVLVLGVTGSASAELIAYWPFDEGSGTTLNDVVGGNNGTLQGDPAWIVGPVNGALEFDGNEDLVTIPNSSVLQLSSTGQYTVAVWVNVVNTAGGLVLFSGQGCVAWANWYLGVTEGEPDARNLGGPPKQEGSLVFGVRTVNWGTVAGYVAAPFVPETWMHVAVTYDGVTLRIYIDGQEVDSAEGVPLPRDNTNMPLNIAGDNCVPPCPPLGRNFFTGKIDDLRIYDEALSQADIQYIMTPASAWKPNPADNGSVAGTDPILSWNPGKQAVTHNVYLGTTMEDVSAATADNHPNVEVSLGQSENTYSPAESLVYGQTYYWRVDEVNGVTIWPGDVWSFLVQPLTAYYPSPVDGARYLDPDVVLSWSPGLGAESHHVYVGTNRTDVETGSGDTDKGSQTTTTLTLSQLTRGQTYYWRVDEFDGTDTHVGDVWNFSILPDIPIRDPHLVGWWKLDEGVGTRAVDWSGYNRHGTIYGGPIWVDGYDGGALEFDGINNYVDLPVDSLIPSLTSCTITTWVDFANTGGSWQRIFGFYNPNGFTSYMTLTPRSGDTGPMTFAIVTDFASPYPGNETNQLIAPSTLASGWHHVAIVIDGESDPHPMQLYLDGTVVAEDITETLPADLNDITSNILGGIIHGIDAYLTGLLDDFRIYDVALTQEEIKNVMRIDTLRAWNPIPSNGALTDVENVLPLSWSPGDEAVQHDVYFGTDYAAVDAADASDTTGIYRNRQDANSYMPPEGVEPNQVYYWRIDEIDTDAMVNKGEVWAFTVLPYLIVDDFEGYDDVNNKIYEVWADYYVNNTGMTVGHLDPSFAELGIVHSGSQSMYMRYDNDGTVNEGTNYEQSGTLTFSEAERQWDDAQDWTRKSANSLTLWFRGVPVSVGSFTEGPPITMTAGGTDIWDTADEFHFAYKQLSGEGSITARIVSVSNTDVWAKAGVMIRESLEPGSVHAMIVVTPGSGVSFQRRTTADSGSESDTEAGITAPQWVRLTRTGNTFTGEYSANGATWTTLGAPLSIPMSVDVYIGLCLTSHNVDATCTAEFSNVSLPSSATGQWQSQDIGIESNIGEQLYVVLQDSAGNSAVVTYSDPAATTIGTWTEWNIPFTDFTGVNLQAVTKMSIGVGDRANTQPGSAGDLYIDDIGLRIPSPSD